MAQVSKYQLNAHTWDRIFELFLDTLVNIKDKDKLDGFIQSIFTPTERIMLAKRLAAALLIAKGHSYQSISGILHLSPPTIAKMSYRVKYESKGITPVIEDIINRQSKDVIIEELKDFLDIPIKGTLKSPDRARRKRQRKSKIDEIKSEF